MVALSTVLGWVKVLTPRLMLSICIVSAILLFSPPAVLARLGLAAFKNAYAQWIGLAFVACVGLLLGHGALEYLPNWLARALFQIKRKRRAGSLSAIEKSVIQGFIHNGTRTQRFKSDSGVIAGLRAFGFVDLAVNRGDPISGFPFNISEWAYQYFQNHPELIAGVEPWNPLDGLP